MGGWENRGTQEVRTPPVTTVINAARISIFGIGIDTAAPSQLIAQIVQRAARGQRTRVCYVNAHVLNLAYRDPALASVLRSAQLVLADGFGVLLGARLLGLPAPERAAITDYIDELAERAAAASVSLYLLGGGPGASEQAASVLRERHPAVQIVGTHHGYLGDDAATAAALAEIRALEPAIVCVGMGSPMQEKWIAAHANEIDAPVVMAVGAVMDHVSGRVERIRPDWMMRWGLEWVGRLLAEPQRLWRRYLLGNPAFVARVLRERSSRRHQR